MGKRLVSLAASAVILVSACGGGDNAGSAETTAATRTKNAALPGAPTEPTCAITLRNMGDNPENKLPILELTVCQPVDHIRIGWALFDDPNGPREPLTTGRPLIDGKLTVNDPGPASNDPRRTGTLSAPRD